MALNGKPFTFDEDIKIWRRQTHSPAISGRNLSKSGNYVRIDDKSGGGREGGGLFYPSHEKQRVLRVS
ncbi:hypothetical protein GWI33_016622 [Rhynchophorus ferrugineus]|uniref:Uncharacterized protein n=1 Tax=Rhynchophorus ferrugineus TaxID=354439 RepID=A0A834I0U5_RHYFE|nr:hypothetical protein GWI33_016622 [Rhynchophorus ferrugineus]